MQKLNLFFYQKAVSRSLVKLVLSKLCYFTHKQHGIIKVQIDKKEAKIKIIKSNVDHQGWTSI